MALEVGVVLQPASGAGVEVELLGLLAAVAAALPGVHGAGEADRLGGRDSVFQPAVAVGQQSAGDLGEVEVEVAQDEELVPEDVAAVGLAVQAPGGYAGVEFGGVRGEGLQDLEEVQAEDEAGLVGHVQFGTAPQVAPGGALVGDELVEGGGGAGVLHGGVAGVGDGPVVAGVQGDDLVDDLAVAGAQLQAEAADAAALGVGVLDLRAGRQCVAGGEGDLDVGVGGGAGQPGDVAGVPGAGAQGGEVPAVEVAVAGDAGVGDGAVEGRLDLDLALPVLGGQLGAQGGEVRVLHADQAGLADEQEPAVRVLVAGAAFQDPGVEAQGLAVLDDACRAGGEPGAVLPVDAAHAEREPVGQVDHVLVLDVAA